MVFPIMFNGLLFKILNWIILDFTLRAYRLVKEPNLFWYYVC